MAHRSSFVISWEISVQQVYFKFSYVNELMMKKFLYLKSSKGSVISLYRYTHFHKLVLH